MQKNIKLIKYKKFGNDLILFEQINTPIVKPIVEGNEGGTSIKK